MKKLVLWAKLVLATPLMALYLVTGLLLCIQERVEALRRAWRGRASEQPEKTRPSS